MVNASFGEGCLVTGVTETRDHHTAAEEAVARRRRDEELSTSLESDVYL